MALTHLTPKQRVFVQVWDGDAVNSMRIAGYSGTETFLKQEANSLLQEPLIQKAIKHRDDFKEGVKSKIADRQERQEFWTAIMRNEEPGRIEEKDGNGIPLPATNIPLPVRLKASETLGKSEIDFVEKVEMTAHTITDLVSQSYKVEEDIESIEAEYYRNKEKSKQLPSPSKFGGLI